MYDYFMNLHEKIQNLTLRQKISQLFITGFEGENPNKNKFFTELLENGLGGVIFFTQNIKNQEQFKQIITSIKDNAFIPPFLSIDQEGGRVERTENIHNGKKYLSAKYAAEKGIEFATNQTDSMTKELCKYGINMNFAPVLDVNTNENNPIIGERAYSNNPDKVIEFGIPIIKKHIENNIIPVGKHFPGHGDASLDSHLSLPCIDLSLKELENNHIKPFKAAIEENLPAIMVAHVHYPCFENEKIPSSMSKKIIQDYLINTLNYDGLIISDDMVMGAVQGFTSAQACIMALKAGINMFIFRNTDLNVMNLIDEIEKAVLTGILEEKTIENSLNKIIKTKKIFGII